MVFDTLDNFWKYIKLNDLFKDVFYFLQHNELINLPLGKIDINNSGAFAIISEYNTKKLEDSFIEYHKKYIDIQIVISGNEKIGYCFYNENNNVMFDEEKDFGKLNADLIFFELSSSNFAIFFPFEGHTPQLDNNNISSFVKKIVFKIPFNL